MQIALARLTFAEIFLSREGSAEVFYCALLAETFYETVVGSEVFTFGFRVALLALLEDERSLVRDLGS